MYEQTNLVLCGDVVVAGCNKKKWRADYGHDIT
jgi:hypothetical protein